VEPWGMQAFKTTNDSIAWQKERIKNNNSKSFIRDDNIIVSSGKALYSIKMADGNVKYKVLLKDDGIGVGEKLEVYKDKIVVIATKGISTHNISDGKLVASNKYKKSFLEAYEGDFLIMKTDRADIACFDLKDCSFKQFKAKNGSEISLTEDGNYVYVYEKKDVTKLNTK